jgi:peptidoglycan/xylan/chitin deacetylase (PgdA/CDA1 family)
MAAVAASAPFDAALRLLEAGDGGRPDHLGVVTYHRIGDSVGDDGLYPGLVSASPAQLDAQLEFLARRYRVVSMDQVVEARSGHPLPRRAVMITFDDAYADFLEVAWPLLRRHRVAATLFVPTAFPDRAQQGFWWDWLYAAIQAAPVGHVLRGPDVLLRITDHPSRMAAFRTLREVVKGLSHDEGMRLVADIGDQVGMAAPGSSVLGWDALRALAVDGVTIAPHSRAHPLLTRIDPNRLADELIGSMDDVRREIGAVPPAIAYPSGAFNDDVVAAAERAGYEVGFTTRRGTNDLNQADWLRLRRINVGARTSLNLLRVQVGRWAELWSG